MHAVFSSMFLPDLFWVLAFLRAIGLNVMELFVKCSKSILQRARTKTSYHSSWNDNKHPIISDARKSIKSQKKNLVSSCASQVRLKPDSSEISMLWTIWELPALKRMVWKELLEDIIQIWSTPNEDLSWPM